ncbi:MAG: hypothetical protein O3B64_01935 [bacterium]|nr:hypothetical protein [bacterium]MDA1024740.1 hypothetical protein [bacterium]
MIAFLLIGIVLVSVPLAILLGFAGYIVIGFVKDDGGAQGVVMIGCITMGVGIFFLAFYFISRAVQAGGDLAFLSL